MKYDNDIEELFGQLCSMGNVYIWKPEKTLAILSIKAIVGRAYAEGFAAGTKYAQGAEVEGGSADKQFTFSR